MIALHSSRESVIHNVLVDTSGEVVRHSFCSFEYLLELFLDDLRPLSVSVWSLVQVLAINPNTKAHKFNIYFDHVNLQLFLIEL